MRWLVTSLPSSNPIGSAKTTRERDAVAWEYLAKQPARMARDWRVQATDTRTGRKVELSRPLRRRSVKPPLALIDNG